MILSLPSNLEEPPHNFLAQEMLASRENIFWKNSPHTLGGSTM